MRVLLVALYLVIYVVVVAIVWTAVFFLTMFFMEQGMKMKLRHQVKNMRKQGFSRMKQERPMFVQNLNA